MNILRKKRKKNIKIRLRRFILVIFSLIMTTFAWFTYSKILNTGVQIDINSWDMSFFVDEDGDNIADPEEEQENPLAIDLSDLYPGMEEKIVKVIIKNNGETPSDILYTSSNINILGNEYTMVDTVPEEGEYYILKYEPVVVDGVSTLDFINEPERFPFKIVIEHKQEILAGGEGYLIIKVTWPSYNADDTDEEKELKDELDTEWGYKVAKYLEDNADNPDVTGAFHVQVRINAIGKPRTDYDESFTAKIVPASYGEYVNYPVDLNDDGNTKNDWKVFYNNGNSVYLIAAEYVPNSKIPTDILEMTKENTHGVFWNDLTNSKLKMDTGIATKFLLTREENFTTTNSNYQAVASLLETDNWTSFVDEKYADSAIGSPTIEMWMRSWNSIYATSEYPNQQLYYNNVNEKGYYIGTEVDPDTTYIHSEVMQNFAGYDNKLFYPYQESSNDCDGYWIASPTAVDSESLFVVNHTGYVDEYTYNSTKIGLRPVVSIKNTVEAEKIDGIWTFIE